MKNIISLTIVIIFVFANASFTYDYWIKTFGGTLDDKGYSMQQTNDGGYIITGYTKSYGAGQEDVWLVKTNAFGNMLWDKTFGVSGSDYGNSVWQTMDGGYIITGRSYAPRIPNYGIFLIKTDISGNKSWDKKYGGHEGNYVQQTSEGGYIIIGAYRIVGMCGTQLIKTDASGNELWEKYFERYGYSGQQTSDGGYIVCGYIFTSPWPDEYTDIWLIKTYEDGELQWEKTFDYTNVESALSVQQTNDGGFIITGWIGDGYASSDVSLIKTDDFGNKLWDKTFDGGGWDYNCGSSVRQTTDGGYIITGRTDAYGGGVYDVWLIKTDSLGNKQWDKTFGGTQYDGGSSVHQTTDGGYIITGSTESFGSGGYDVLLIYYNPEDIYQACLSDLNLFFAFLIIFSISNFLLFRFKLYYI